MKYFKKKFILVYFSFIIQSCAYIQTDFHNKIVAQERKSLSSETIYIDVNLRGQSHGNLCSIASMHMLIDYYKTSFSDSDRDKLIQIAERQNGLTGLQIKNALICAGYSAYVLKGDLSDEISGISYHLKKNHPLLVMLKTGNQTANINHMVLLIGFDPLQRKVIFLDPQVGQTILRLELFNKQWQQANNFMLVAIPDKEATCEY